MFQVLTCLSAEHDWRLAEQLAILRTEGCTEIQGYLVSPPQPSAGIAKILRNDEYTAVAWRLSAPNFR